MIWDCLMNVFLGWLGLAVLNQKYHFIFVLTTPFYYYYYYYYYF